MSTPKASASKASASKASSPPTKNTAASSPTAQPAQSSQPTAPPDVNPSPTEASPESPVQAADTTEITPRPILDLQPSRRSSLAVAYKRPIDPSPVQVSYTVSLAGTRPVMRNSVNPTQTPIDFTATPYVMNRPIAPNTTEDNTKMLEYLD